METTSLPLLFALVLENLRALGYGDGHVDADNDAQAVTLVGHCAPWLYNGVNALTSSGRPRVWMRKADAAPKGSEGIFTSSAARVVLGPQKYGQDAFAKALVRAFYDLRQEVNLLQRAQPERPLWLARWIAGAALTAHVRLCSRADNRLVVRLDAEPGEDSLSVAPQLAEVLGRMPGPQLLAMPLHYRHCVPTALAAILKRLRDALATLSNPTAVAGDVRIARGHATWLTYYLASIDLERRKERGDSGINRKKISLVVPQTLLDFGIAATQADAMTLMGEMGIADESVAHASKSESEELRARTPVHEGVLIYRGKRLYLIELARAWQAVGLLTAGVLSTFITAATLRGQVVNALVQEGIIEGPEAAALQEKPHIADIPTVKGVSKQQPNQGENHHDT